LLPFKSTQAAAFCIAEGAGSAKYMITREFISCSIDSIDPLTWKYLMQGTPAVVQQSKEIITAMHMEEDECIRKKLCSIVESCMLIIPEHLAVAQGIFGKTAVIGVQFIVPCPIGKKQNRVDYRRQSSKVIP
jgi:hypothetical protein